MNVVIEKLTLVAKTPQSFVTKDEPCAVRSRSISLSNSFISSVLYFDGKVLSGLPIIVQQDL